LVKLHDPQTDDKKILKAAHRELIKAPTLPPPIAAPRAPQQAQERHTVLHRDDPLAKDFRVFLTLIWRFLLGVDPNPIQLDMAWWLQHGPDRAVIMAFRGFSKSWITGAYALWRLYRNPQEKILVVSGSLIRAVATTNWCLNLIMSIPELAFLRPSPKQRQSSRAFDVGPALPDQSPSFHALGIGGQIVGFRGDCIVPDDVETQQNSLTLTMRDKIREAVKEFDSVLKPGGVIKYLGTPHDEDSLYSELIKRGYTARIWPALFPTAKQIKGYGDRLAPYIRHALDKDPMLVGSSTMPNRFSNDDLAKRRLSLGNSEFALQFMLDTRLSDKDKYPLKIKDMSVLSLDPRRGPSKVVWTNDPEKRLKDLASVGFEGDYWYSAIVPEGADYLPYNRVVGSVDSSGRGDNETSLHITAELHGVIFFLYSWATRDGYDRPTLEHIAEACVKYRVQTLRVESNFGDGMFAALLQPYLTKAWKKENEARRKRNIGLLKGEREDEGGTSIEEVRASNQMAKEKRILSVMEPVVQQHRLVVSQAVIEWDIKSVEEYEGVDIRHHYQLWRQFSRLTKERESLRWDDRIDNLALNLGAYADILGVDPGVVSAQAEEDALEEELLRLQGDDLDGGGAVPDLRPASMRPTSR
jgi:hypothetical protein